MLAARYKTMKKTFYEWAGAMVLLVLATIPAMMLLTNEARGDLTAKVYPGYVFQSGQRVTVDQLNRLGVPTIVIVGTLDGTNVGLSAGSVSGTMLAADVVDNVTTSFTNASIRVKPGGITTLQMDTNMFNLFSAMDPSGGLLRWNPDWNFLAISNNQATVRTTLLAKAISAEVTNLVPNQIVLAENRLIIGGPNGTGMVTTVSSVINASAYTYSNSAALPSAGSVQTFTHGMGNNPSYARVTLWNISTEQGYAVGDEMDISAVYANSGQVGFSVFQNAGVLKVTRNNGTLKLLKASDGTEQDLTAAKWAIVVRVRP